MEVQLTLELEQIVQDQVSSGRYGSQTDVLSEALKLLAERDGSIENS